MCSEQWAAPAIVPQKPLDALLQDMSVRSGNQTGNILCPVL